MSDNKGDTSEPTSTLENPYDESDKQKRIFKIIVIGDSNVGKTCLTFRFCGGKFPEKTEATIGVDFREKTIDVDGESLKLQLWDTAGQERFRKSMVQHYYRNVHAVVFVYDMTKLSTFESLPTWIDECDRHSLSPDIPRVLVGNKCDIREKVLVTTGMAQKFADANNMPLFETSALDSKESENVIAIFMTLAHKLKTHRPMMLPLSTPATDAHKSRIVRVDEKPHYEFERDSDGPCPC
ncbi:putative Ras-related protein Rab-33 [Anneissia japonica]|uniref:putative Ras-related protein Rab-33 n=1 Tax=Anneissia japonica TaxID=1529436 RepID=UPI001425551C|nr:putative Ras-related protein Rab-33 [Anneissia japonica]